METILDHDQGALGMPTNEDELRTLVPLCHPTVAEYDGLEAAENGPVELGYLALSAGVLVAVASETKPGHRANRFPHYLYGCVLGSEQHQGWFPSAVFEAIEA